MSAVQSFRSGITLYQALLAQAAREGSTLLSHALSVARQSMREDIGRCRGFLERDHLELGIKLLDSHALRMCERYAVLLAAAFKRLAVAQARPYVLASPVLRLDQLELMDESQVQERVEMARALQQVSLKTESALTEFNTYVCALLGLEHVSHERNPLRPDSYVSALQQLMSEIGVPAVVRLVWLQHLSAPLGDALSAAYLEWSAQLAGQGVQAAGFSVVRVPGAPASVRLEADSRADRVVWSSEYRQTVLTLDRLRRLMAGELDASPPDNPKQAFARQFAQEFESGAADSLQSESGFQATVPAAFEALQEMQQVDVVVQRMKGHPVVLSEPSNAGAAGLSVRELLRRQARGMSQSLSLEVVALMVDNLVQDTRLLEPVRHIIGRLEPALLHLVLIDPRFFIDKQHPARRLLQEISERGLAFGALDDPDFNAFLVSLQRFVSPLAAQQIDSAQPFEEALANLLQAWDLAGIKETVVSQIDTATAALAYAEERNLLAISLATSLQAIPAIRLVPESVSEFLAGPWSQVMASAQLKDKTGADDPGAYKELVNSLLWSAQPELTRRDIGQLTKLVPRLLSVLREGLQLIDYPATRTSVFFDVLMKLHQQAFRPAAAKPPQKEAAAATGLAASLLGSQDHWVAPAEAKASGFMTFADDVVAPPRGADAAVPVVPAKPLSNPSTDPAGAPGVRLLALGTWVELQVKSGWQRTQLSWISPQGTMYLFTSGQGKTQSMTQRMFERMIGEGTLRVVSEQSMLDGALDAVVQTAMQNSLDVRV